MENQQPAEGVNMGGDANLEKNNLRLFLVGLGSLLAVGLVIFLGVILYRVYWRVATDSFTVGVAKALRLPAAKVGSTVVYYGDYVNDLRAINVMRAYDAKVNGPGAALTDEKMSDQVLWRLANNILVNQVARQYQVTVSDDEVNEAKKAIVSKFKDSASADAETISRYGWDMNTYAANVIRPYLLQEKVAKAIEADTNLLAKSKSLAEEVLTKVKAGGDFVELAKQYGQDGTAAQGGDLGWFPKGAMVPEFENAIWPLKAGEVAQTVVETQFGFHVVKMEERKVEKVKDDKGKMVDQEQVHARHIIFRLPSLAQFLDDSAKQLKPRLFVHVHNPFTDTTAAVNQ